MITAVNASVTVLEDIGADDDARASDVTIAELESISPALTDINESNEVAYQAYIEDPENEFSAPATWQEVQDMITAVNTSLVEVWYKEDDNNGTTYTYSNETTKQDMQTAINIASDFTPEKDEDDSVRLQVSVPTPFSAPAVTAEAPAECNADSYSAFIILFKEKGEVETGYSYADSACGDISDATIYDKKRLRFVPGTSTKLESSTNKGGMVIIIDAQLKKATKFGEK
jgi:hypothetical protein